MHTEKTLPNWLAWIKSLHVKNIDLELSRIKDVAKRMDLLHPTFPIITVGGTNGKGSTVAALEAIYTQAGYRVGAFTSPFLFRFNEQIKMNGREVSDKELCDAFLKVELVRDKISLTPFEFNTLAALSIFKNANLDVCILEVGLGGRLDAVNILDADLAIVTSIDIDHADWLGDTHEKIAFEKAGIFRNNKPAICGDFNPPQSLIEYANSIGSQLYSQNKNFGYKENATSWSWWSEKTDFEQLPLPQLLLQNMSTVLMGVELLSSQLPVQRKTIDDVMKNISLPGRIQIIPDNITTICDVSHNPASVSIFSKYLKKHPISGKSYAVFSMLGDKDISATLSLIKNDIDIWHVASLQCDRAASQVLLTQHFFQNHIQNVLWFDSIKKAYDFTKTQAKLQDRIIIFGSFHTVAEAIEKITEKIL